MTSRRQENSSFQNFLLIVLAVIFPPIPVFILDNYCVWTKPMLITVLLTIFGHVPGIIFAIYYIVEYGKFNTSPRTGYVRLDEEESVPHTSNHVDHPPVSPPGSSSTSSPQHFLTPEHPPNYQDVVPPSDSKLSDNKVQQS
jgi:uncharacterized membrane protein YqaE (UPF0057 family)